jgi:type IX secretion system PorP/SprF family membrane protein
MNKKFYIAVSFLMCVTFAHAQQQTLYTNYLLNQYLYNPAYAGVPDGTQFNVGYRNQWVGFDGAPKTYVVSGFGKMKKKPNMAVGGIVTSERIGLLQRTTVHGTYSYHLKINQKASINFGLGIGGIQHKVRVYDARPYDKDDYYVSSDILTGFSFDANAGFYLYTKNFFLGFSDQHMSNSKIRWANSIGKNTTHFYAYSGYNFSLDKKREWIIQPSILARTNSPAPYQLEYNLRLLYREMIWVGGSYRHQSSASFMLGCNIDKQYTFAYSYDYTLSQLSKYSTGTHEIVLSYLIPFQKKKSKHEQVKEADEEELNAIDNTLKTNLRSKKKKEEVQKKHHNKTDKANESPAPEQTEPKKDTEPAKASESGEESGLKGTKTEGNQEAELNSNQTKEPENKKEPETTTNQTEPKK